MEKVNRLIPFDAVRYLIDKAAIAEYTEAVRDLNDPALNALASDDIARARERLPLD